MSAIKCQYSESCPIFMGNEAVENPPLPIYKNVFCLRGSRGWKNCLKFSEFQSDN